MKVEAPSAVHRDHQGRGCQGHSSDCLSGCQEATSWRLSITTDRSTRSTGTVSESIRTQELLQCRRPVHRGPGTAEWPHPIRDCEDGQTLARILVVWWTGPTSIDAPHNSGARSACSGHLRVTLATLGALARNAFIRLTDGCAIGWDLTRGQLSTEDTRIARETTIARPENGPA